MFRRPFAHGLALVLLAAPLAALRAAPSPVVDGDVTKIDRAQARLTLRHGEIRGLDIPAMTMTYRVASARMLEGLAVGDKVRFSVDKVDGAYTVTSLAKAR